MKERTGLTYLNFAVVCFLTIFIYLFRNRTSEILFYSTALIAVVLCASSLFILVKRYKLKLITVVGVILLGLSLVFIVKTSLDQRMNFYLQRTLASYLPSASLHIVGAKQYHVDQAKLTDFQGHYPDETRTMGKFFPHLPYHQSEAVLVDNHSPDHSSVSYRFIFKHPYIIDNKDVSTKACLVWGICSYFYKGYADINPATDEVISLKIQYKDIK